MHRKNAFVIFYEFAEDPGKGVASILRILRIGCNADHNLDRAFRGCSAPRHLYGADKVEVEKCRIRRGALSNEIPRSPLENANAEGVSENKRLL
jgi:hypothetical protein